MKKEEITALFGKFESISCEVEGIECWSARELQPLLAVSYTHLTLPTTPYV